MHPKIKSYCLRAGRITNRQKNGLERLSQFAMPQAKERWDFNAYTKKQVILEIGFGMGQSLLEMAKKNPDFIFIGAEVHLAGIGSLVSDLIEHNISNVRIAPVDAQEIIEHYLPDESLSGSQIFFPDPWPKKRHHKRRLIQPLFVKQLTKKLKPNGFLHCATDWEEYAKHILAVLNDEPLLRQSQIPRVRPRTKFEARGIRLGHQVWDILYIKA